MRLKQDCLTTYHQQIVPLANAGGTKKTEAKMNSLHSQQMWDLMRERQAELLREAKQVQLARLAKQSQSNSWKNPFQRQAQSPALVLETSASPELS